jgi:branched-subunit amino acid transport protein
MLFLLYVLITLTAVVIIPRMRVAGSVNATKLGQMSQRWLAEHRASHSL